LHASRIVRALPEVERLAEGALCFVEAIRFDARCGVQRPEPSISLGEQRGFTQRHQRLPALTALLGTTSASEQELDA
jgi:hypothetical protein